VAYVIEAMVAPSSVARRVSAKLVSTRAVQLSSGYELVPLVPQTVQALSPGDDRVISLLVRSPLPERLTAVLRWASAYGPIAYIEADFVGGVGQQGGVLWEDGETVLGPIMAPPEPGPPSGLEDGPINLVLRRMGVRRSSPRVDEFATLGLGRCSETAQWLDYRSVAGGGHF
jgi:hypothetical protein